MAKLIVTFLFVLSTSIWAAPVVHMQYVGFVTAPGFFIFEIDGEINHTLCDQYDPNVTTEPYLATVATLDSLTGTTLERAGDPLALFKYQQVAILALQAYEDPELAPDVTRAIRYIVDGSGPMTTASTSMFEWVQTQDPAAYPLLSEFKIYANPIAQEQVGYNSVPEPGTIILMCVGMAVIGINRGRIRIRRS